MMNPADAEFALLSTAEGRACLDQVATVGEPGPADIERWRRAYGLEATSAALRLTEAVRKAASKFPEAEGLWLDPVGVEQATDARVAAHKAERFRDASLVVDLCCGIGSDTRALARVAQAVLAVDLDSAMVRRARWNAQKSQPRGKVLGVVGDARRFAVPAGALVHVDPDRRPVRGQRPTRDLHRYVPDFGQLRDLSGQVAGGAIKLGPASDFASLAEVIPGSEVELISLHRECKEATLWFGSVAGSARRRATVLPSGESFSSPRPAGHLAAPSVAAQAGLMIYEPDPSLVRSGLLDAFGLTYGLARLQAGGDWLAGAPVVPEAARAFLSGFTIEEVLSLDRRSLVRAIERRGVSVSEIKTRGLDSSWRPEALRGEFRGSGPRAVTLILLAGRGGPGVALLAYRA